MFRIVAACACPTAFLVVGMRHFEEAMITGQVPLRVCAVVVGAFFLGAGVFVGMHTRREPAPALPIVESNGLLTPREAKVLQHLVAGRTNR
jgi:hypothetical protein